MADESKNPYAPKTDADKELLRRALSYSDNTLEEERREIREFMRAAWADTDARLPPYDWGDNTPEIKAYNPRS